MYLSRLILDPFQRTVQQDLANCHNLHRTIMSAFPGVEGEDARARLGVLYRIEPERRGNGIVVLVQSAEAPDWTRLLPRYPRAVFDGPRDVRQLSTAIAAADVLRFRLFANPTKRAAERLPAGLHARSKRVDLRTEAAQIDWLARKGDQHGFRLAPGGQPGTVAVLAVPGGQQTGWRGGPTLAPLTLASVRFDGLLVVTDPTRFRDALARGIGPGKAYGFGLLSIAPVR